MDVYLGALNMGLLLGFLAIGVHLSYRVGRGFDLTTDGSFGLGGCTAVALLLAGWNPWLATAAAVLAGALAGCCTSAVSQRLAVPGVLAGVLTLTALLSVNALLLGGRASQTLDDEPTLVAAAEDLGFHWAGEKRELHLYGLELNAPAVGLGAAGTAAVALAVLALYGFLRSNLGLALRAVGDNPRMAAAQGVSTANLNLLLLALANGLAALSGALWAQYQGLADMQMGLGMLVAGLGAVLVGEAVPGLRRWLLGLVGAVVGAIAFRLVVAFLIREVGLTNHGLRLVTAVVVLAVVATPLLLQRRAERRARRGSASEAAP